MGAHHAYVELKKDGEYVFVIYRKDKNGYGSPDGGSYDQHLDACVKELADGDPQWVAKTWQDAQKICNYLNKST